MLLTGSVDFSLGATFECGQAFRFVSIGDGRYRGVYQRTVLTLSEIREGLLVEQQGELISEGAVRFFLDFDRDYRQLGQELIQLESRLTEAVQLGSGIRLLRQPPFEALVSFILSSNSNMKRIQSQIESLATRFGSLIGQVEGRSYYAFPTHDQLKHVPLETYREMGLGYRAEYLFELILQLGGKEVLERYAVLDTDALIRQLRTFKGIGEKVASCIALFGYGRQDAFPIDVWIKRYFQNELHHETWSLKEMEAYGHETYGHRAGLAQQYMFYFMLKKYKGL